MGCGNSTETENSTAVRRSSSGRLSSENRTSRKYNASRNENSKNDDVVINQEGEREEDDGHEDPTRPPAIDVGSPSHKKNSSGGPNTKEHPLDLSQSEDGITDTKTTESSNPNKSNGGRKNSQSSVSTFGVPLKPDDHVEVWMTPPPSPNNSSLPLGPESPGIRDNRSLLSNGTGGTGNGIVPFSPSRFRGESPHGAASSGEVPSTPHSMMNQSITSAQFNMSQSRIGMTQAEVASGCVSPLAQGSSQGFGAEGGDQQAEFGSFPAGGMMTPLEPDNNVGDCEQAELARQVYSKRKESVSGGNTDEPSPFMQKCAEAYRETKYRAVAALTHETDHDELHRISLKPKNAKMIQRCSAWMKAVAPPQPRKIKFKKLNELRTLTEGSPESVHFGRSISMMYYEREGLIRSRSPAASSSVKGSGPFSPVTPRTRVQQAQAAAALSGDGTPAENSFKGGNSSQYLGSYTSMPGEVTTIAGANNGAGGSSIHAAPSKPVPVMMSLPVPPLPASQPSDETKQRLENEWQ